MVARGVQSDADPYGAAETLWTTGRTRVTRLFLPGCTAVRKEFLGPEAERRLWLERTMLERVRGLAGVAELVEEPRYAGSIVLADLGGPSLAGMATPLDVDILIGLASALAAAVAAMHRRGVLHRDISPANIVLSRDGTPALVGFGSAMALAEISPEFLHHTEITGTLGYLAPEQTGRTGRSVDQRADLYALGATLYELATGRPPFGSGDPLRLIHDHLARVPTPPAALNPALPAPLSEIIMHLLEKEPDRRYQSADGLVHDLGRLSADSGPGPLRVGERDVPLRLLPPSQLVGRDAEVAARAAFADALAGRCRAVLVGGAPGVGKTALVAALRPVVTGGDGWFISGKFDQYRRDLDSFLAVTQRGDHGAGYRASRRVLAWGEARGYEPSTSRARHMFSLLSCWSEPIENGVHDARRAREGLIAGGDLATAGYTYVATVRSLADCAPTLEDLRAEVDSGLAFVRRTGNDQTGQVLDGYRWLVAVLRGDSQAAVGDPVPADRYADNPLALLHAHLTRALAAAVLGDPGCLARHSSAAMPLLPVAAGFYSIAVLRMLRGLALVEQARAGGTLRAVLLLENRLIRGAFTAERLDAVKLIAAQLTVSLDNAQLYAELTASRARIVTASDQTRRRIERDLHDGAQQRLANLAIQARLAQDAVPGSGELAARLDAWPQRRTRRWWSWRARPRHPPGSSGRRGLASRASSAGPPLHRPGRAGRTGRRAAARTGRDGGVLRRRGGADQHGQARRRHDRHRHRGRRRRRTADPGER